MPDSLGANHAMRSFDTAYDRVLAPLAKVSSDHGLERLTTRLLELRQWLQDDLASLEAGLEDIQQQSTSLAQTHTRQAAQHILDLRGKRIRPICVLLAARLGGLHMDARIRKLAIASELVHAATLLHDDVIDDSPTRRGAAAAQILYGNSASILAGDHLLVRALQLVQQTQAFDLVGQLLDAIARMVTAEALQLERRGQFTPDRQTYLQVISGKTAALFSWSLEAGGRLSQLPEAACQALIQVGEQLGLAFQLVDDVLDLEGDPAVTGKAALTDVREGKITWPLILAAERDPALGELLATLASSNPEQWRPAHVSELMQRLQATDALSATRQFARERAKLAHTHLQSIAPSRARDALQVVINSTIFRIG